MFVSRQRLTLLFCLFALFLFGHLLFVSSQRHVSPKLAIRKQTIVSLASSKHRLDRELPITLRSLTAQTVPPAEIRVYLPKSDKDVVNARLKTEAARASWLPDPLLHPLVTMVFVDDVGPATKFVPILKDCFERADAGSEAALDQPVIIVDDDHSYTPALVDTLIKAHHSFPNSSVGLRGWRVREDLHWGVLWDEIDRHVIQGYKIAEPYRVGVLTANEGYLVVPRFFLPSTTLRPPYTNAAPLLDAKKLADTPAHLVDDIWMAGSLAAQGVPRVVVPLPAAPSVDVTVVHTLETHMDAEGMSRGDANDATLQLFADAWRADGLWYRFAKDVVGAKGVISHTSESDEPVTVGLIEKARKGVGAWWRGVMVKLGAW